MSIWTHVLGVIRFDNYAATTWPVTPNKDQILNNAKNYIHGMYAQNVPEGSEGPLEINTILTNRGVTVIITGDLRDFDNDDVNDIVEWLNGVPVKPREKVDEIYEIWHIRDSSVSCSTEGCDLIIIRYDFDKNKWLAGRSLPEMDVL